MKPAEEIYKIRFGNILENGTTTYFICILGSEGEIYHELVTPEKITLVGARVIIYFTNKTKMMFKFDDSVQLFYREIEDGGDTQTKSDKKAVRRRKNPK